MATPGMSGAGVYNRNSSLQREMQKMAEDHLVTAVQRIGAVEPEFTIVDYGCGPGRNSNVAVRTAVNEYRKCSPRGKIVVIHNDQIGNDWNDLFENIAGPDGYLPDDGTVRCQASAGSFYNAVTSPDSINLGMSFTAVQWLQAAVELPSPGTLFFADLTGEPRRMLAETARRDWTQFLRNRARELRPEGRLLVQCLGAVPDDRAPGGTESGVRELFRVMWDAASNLADEGHIDRDLLDLYVMPQWFRTVNEARGPIDEESDLSRAFDVEEIFVERVALPFAEEYRHSGDAGRYAADYTAFVRAFTERTFQISLFAPSAGDARAADELNELYFSRLRSLFYAAPGEHDYAVWSLVVLLRRT